jgi:quinol monooxygenase YgiN
LEVEIMVALRAIVELKAKPGRRDELLAALEELYRSVPSPDGFVGRAHYLNVDDPDGIIDINDWESEEQYRTFHQSVDPSSMRPLMDILAEPFRRTLAGELNR